MHVLAVGQPYDPAISQWPEGCHYNFDDSGHWLHYLFRNPSEAERRSIQAGQAQFGLYVNGPIIFLLHQFGEMPWNDASYSWWRVSEESRQIPEVSGEIHALLKVVMVDTDTGLVAAMRALTFSAPFTKRLHEAIRYQSEQPRGQALHDEIIQDVYARYPTEDLVGMAEIFCKGGE